MYCVPPSWLEIAQYTWKPWKELIQKRLIGKVHSLTGRIWSLKWQLNRPGLTLQSMNMIRSCVVLKIWELKLSDEGFWMLTVVISCFNFKYQNTSVLYKKYFQHVILKLNLSSKVYKDLHHIITLYDLIGWNRAFWAFLKENVDQREQHCSLETLCKYFVNKTALLKIVNDIILRFKACTNICTFRYIKKVLHVLYFFCTMEQLRWHSFLCHCSVITYIHHVHMWLWALKDRAAVSRGLRAVPCSRPHSKAA